MAKASPKKKPAAKTPPAPVAVPQLAPPPVTRKLDLGCGESPREGFEGVDRFDGPTVKHVVNLFKFPWPFEDNSVAELHASHFLEHIPMIEVDDEGSQVPFGEGTDLLFAFMNEAYRVLVPGGVFTIVVPAGSGDRAFQDPTHRRFFVVNTFAYFSKREREAMKLGHYGATHDFGANVAWSVTQEFNSLHPEVQQRHVNHYRNGIVDLHATLIAQKG